MQTLPLIRWHSLFYFCVLTTSGASPQGWFLYIYVLRVYFMSLKLAAYRVALPQPALSCNFSIHLPWGVEGVAFDILCQSASLPYENTKATTITIGGKSFSVPGKRESNLTWTCVVPVNSVLLNLLDDVRNKYTHEGVTGSIHNAYIGDEVVVSLVSSVGGGLVPVYSRVLHNVWLSGIDNLNLEANSINPLVMRLTFQYSYSTPGSSLLNP